MNLHKPQYNSFLNLPPSLCDWNNSQACVLQTPIEGSLHLNDGAALAPQAILRASEFLSRWDDELGFNAAECGIATRSVDGIDSRSTQESIHKITHAFSEISSAQKWPLVLGGDSSVIIALCQHLAKQDTQNTSILHLNANAEVLNSIASNQWASQCSSRRILELGLDLHLATPRKIHPEEKEFLLSNPQGLAVHERVLELNPSKIPMRNNVFLALNMNFFDPSECPAVLDPEPLGEKLAEFLNFLNSLFCTYNVMGAALTGLAPMSGNSQSEYFTAKVAYKTLSLALQKRSYLKQE